MLKKLSHDAFDICRPLWNGFPNVVLAGAESEIKKFPTYPDAKAGEFGAAQALAEHFLNESVLGAIAQMVGQRTPNVLAVLAEEARGKNIIPVAMADVIAHHFNWPLSIDICQINVVSHTGSGGFYRLATPALFGGNVLTEQDYFLVDDFIGQGGTLANLRAYLAHYNASSLGAICLTGRTDSAILSLTDEALIRLREKHGNLEKEWIAHFGYGFDALTESEARYLINTPDAQRIRDRVFKANGT